MNLIDADELIERLTIIRDRPYNGQRGFQNRRKYNLNKINRDRISADIKIIKKMIEENRK